MYRFLYIDGWTPSDFRSRCSWEKQSEKTPYRRLMKLGLFLSTLPHVLKFAFHLSAFNLHPNICFY